MPMSPEVSTGWVCLFLCFEKQILFDARYSEMPISKLAIIFRERK